MAELATEVGEGAATATQGPLNETPPAGAEGAPQSVASTGGDLSETAPADGAQGTAPEGAEATWDAARLVEEAGKHADDLKRKVDALIGRPTAEPGKAPETTAPPTTSLERPQPAATQTPGPIPLRFDDPTLDALYDKWTNKDLDEKGAFKVLVNEVGNLILSAVRQDPLLLDRAYEHTLGRASTSARVDALGDTVEQFWKGVAPEIPAKLLWAYADEAARVKPDDLVGQVTYCLERAAKDVGPITRRAGTTARQQEALTRTAGASLPAGSGRGPTAPVAEPVLTFADQAKQLRLGMKRPF